MIINNTNEGSTNHGLNINIHSDAADNTSRRRIHTFVTRRSPRRMYLCDVPLFFEHECSNSNTTDYDDDDINFVRLMGTIVEIIQPSPLIPPTGPPSHPPIDTNQHTSVLHSGTMKVNAQQHQTIQFVIDDGTGVIAVLYERRGVVEMDNASNRNYRTDTPTSQQQNISTNTNDQSSDNKQLPPSASATMTMLETLLSSSPSFSLGQTVDCIGRLHVADDSIDEGCSPDAIVGDVDNHHSRLRRKGSSFSSSRMLLVASSISLVNNPQAVTLRQLELSSSSRWGDNGQLTSRNNNNNFRHNNNQQVPTPRNRILIGGNLERKLNPLYHCNQQGSVCLNLEDAFHFIKHSKDDGGITTKEIASLVGAFESNEVLAVNLAVERLREDCRIYLNQGKWFPM